MQIHTPKELIEILSKYQPDEQLLITWWSQEDVEMLLADEDIEDDAKAKKIWEKVNSNIYSDSVIENVNDQLSHLVSKEL